MCVCVCMCVCVYMCVCVWVGGCVFKMQFVIFEIFDIIKPMIPM